MMYQKELTPVHYNRAAVKSLKFLVDAKELSFPMHWHERMEIILVNEGILHIDNGKEILSLQAGDMTVFAPRAPHKGYTRETSVEYEVLMFDIRSFYNDTDICKESLPVVFEGGAQFKKIIREKETMQCFKKIVNQSEINSMEIIAQVYRLIYLLIEHGAESFNRENIRDKGTMKMIKYVEDHFQEEMTIEKLAKVFGYSKEHFCRKFKEATGLAPMQYLGIYRIEMAEKMLKYTNQRISDIAQQCGFYDANYFTRRFKAHFGMAPTKYIMREENNEKSE